jgi:hypothetical protein
MTRTSERKLLIAADLALLSVLIARGTGSNLPLMGFLVMGNVMALAPRRGAWRGFGVGGGIAVAGYLVCCGLLPARVAAFYETVVVPFSTPVEDALFTNRLADAYASGSVSARLAVVLVAAIVNAVESFLLGLPQFAFALRCGGMAKVAATAR